MPFPNPETQFKPGVSGNPAGTSKRRRMADRLYDALEKMIIEKDIDTGDLLIEEWLRKLVDSGDTEGIKAIFDRTDGPLPRSGSLTHDGALVIKVEYADLEPAAARNPLAEDIDQ